MIKENLMQAKSFITFDLPLDNRYISAQFTSTHGQNLINHPYWSLKATRKKIIFRYWFEFVSMHFSILYGVAVIITLLFNSEDNRYFLPAIVMAGGISFFVLLLTQYWPIFYSDLLPKLDTLVNEFENRQKANLQQRLLKELQNQFTNEYEHLAQQREELAKERERLELLQKELLKCRKAQFQTLTLVLIIYVLDQSAGMNSLQCNDRTAALLTKLLGKDQGGIKDNLQLILGKKQELSVRYRTEIQNRFNEAFTFFDEIQFEEGRRLLQSLETKFRD